MLVNAHGLEAENVVMQLHLPFNFLDGLVWCFNVEQHIMAFAVFFDPISEGAQPPIFGFADATALFGDGGAKFVKERLRALWREVLSGDENVLVKCHGVPKESIKVEFCGKSGIFPSEALYIDGRMRQGQGRGRLMKAFIFPGQGSQFIGMGAALAESWPVARRVFDEVDEALGESLSQKMWSGTAEELTLTQNAQPALLAASMAVVRVLEDQGVDLARAVKFVAGHSLGEYSALTAAGSLSLSDSAKLLRLRGAAMQRAVPSGQDAQGAMAALLGLDYQDVADVVKNITEGVVALANDNAPGQIVISGDKNAVSAAMALAKEKGCKKAIMLSVSAPFHCPLMAPAAAEMDEALAQIKISTPKIAVVENMIAKPIERTEDIHRLLVEQITGCVRWRETISYMIKQGVTDFFEIGAGKVLSGMIKRIDRQAQGHAVGEVEEVEKLLKALT